MRRLLALLLPVLAGGCAARTAAPAGPPVADPAALAAELQRATTPAGPTQAAFAWTLDESGSRLRGRGVVRFVAPERLRLDLFGPRGETYLAAALVGDQVRLPPAVAAERVPLPSPVLLWAALGVIRPPEGANIKSATAADTLADLSYGTAAGETFRFRAAGRGEQARLVSVERIGDSGVLESVQLQYAPHGTLTRAQYRNWGAYRELILEVETITNVASFDESIWSPGAAGR